MNLTDPVADFLTRIRNSIRARHQKLDVPASKLKSEIARILKEEGYIANYKPTEEGGMKVLRVYLKYGPNNEAVIRDLQRVSRPGCRVYLGRDEIARAGRTRHLDHDHAEGRDDRPPGAPRRRWRRDSLRSLVDDLPPGARAFGV
jgi:small subunit ribosomal protein S8